MFPAPPPKVCFIRQLEDRPADLLLDRQVGCVDFDGMKFSELLASLANSQHLNIAFLSDSTSRDQNTDSRITLHLRHTKLRHLLDLVASGSGISDLDWSENVGVITFGERDKVAAISPILAREYDIRPLLAKIRRDRERFGPTFISPNIGWFDNEPVPGTVTLESDAHLAEGLILVMTEHISPETWQVNGGDSKCILTYINGKLLVGQREAVHWQIERFLDQLAD
jgi:hypothetical protein